MITFRGCFLFFAFLISGSLQAQIISVNGNLMGEFINYEQNLIPAEDSEGFVVPDTTQLKQWKRMMDLFVAESYSQAEDSLSANFPDYEMVLLTDTSFINREYYLIREKYPVSLGWGLFASDPDYQRDAIIAVPHPIHDSFTPQEGVNMFQYLGGRLLVMAGTHRCANDEAAVSDGTTTVCNDTQTSEKYKVSDMAHYDSTAFQIAHESMKELSNNVYAINLHGHANSSCEDVFLSNGRSDDPQPSLQTVRDSLIANNIDAAMTGDGSLCTLAGTTNVQGRYINGSTNPADDQPVNNTGFFFHVEQVQNIRRSLQGHIHVIEAFRDLIPRSFSTVTFPDYPSLTINEIHFNPDGSNGDANNNGSVGSVSDEFLEIINSADTTISLDNWIIADNTADRHVIPSGTNLLPGQALVVFGQDSFTGDFGGATVQGASTSSLSLNNSGDKLSIKSPANDVITFLEYPGDESGVSITLNPDITGDSLVSHSTADTDDNSLFSPGTKINGDSFLPFVEISGDAGWRMMAAPTTKMPISDLTAFSPIQGFGDGHDKNFYTSWNGTEWIAPNSLSDSLENGNGFIIYFFDNENAESSSLPVTLRGTGTVPTSDVTIDLHTSGDKWNLIGNPFDSAIDFSEITVNGGQLVSNVGYIYDPSISNYVTTTSLGDSVAAWQGIFVKDSTASDLTIPYSSRIEAADFLKQAPINKSYIVLELSDEQHKYADELVLTFSESFTAGWDLWDLPDLPSLSTTHVSMTGKLNDKVSQSQFSLPFRLIEKFEIPLSIRNNSPSESLYFRVKKKINIPEHLNIKLTNLDSGHHFEILSSGFDKILFSNSNLNSSLRLEITSEAATSGELDPELPNEFSVTGNYPNPFNPSTQIEYELPDKSYVLFQVYSVSGALIYQKEISAQISGKHSLNFNASDLSSGVYLYSFKTKFGTRTGKMILLK
ncbi:MAG: lamin tail domain-containing protein [Balneola sp.]